MTSTRRFSRSDAAERPAAVPSGAASPGDIGGSSRRDEGRSGRLSRAEIVGAAVAFVDEHGLADLTMRDIAHVLGVEAMSLYRYVSSRESLLDGMVESVVDELYADPEVYLEPRTGWKDYLTRLAFGVRRIAMAHPRLFPLVSTRPPAAPWVRPPLRSLRWMNSFLEGLVDDGFSDDDAAAVYRAFTSFLLGHLLLDVAALNVDLSPVADDRAGSPAGAAPATASDALAEYPYLERMQDNLSQDFALPEFTSSLHNLLDRLADLRTATG